MPYKMTKRGSLDNEITNEFFCDTIEDRNAIPASDINLGTIAIVLKPGTQVFIADSNKEWNVFGAAEAETEPEVEEGVGE